LFFKIQVQTDADLLVPDQVTEYELAFIDFFTSVKLPASHNHRNRIMLYAPMPQPRVYVIPCTVAQTSSGDFLWCQRGTLALRESLQICHRAGSMMIPGATLQVTPRVDLPCGMSENGLWIGPLPTWNPPAGPARRREDFKRSWISG
jgi:hypothetical protein